MRAPSLLLACGLLTAVPAASEYQAEPSPSDVGVLVMAHGGSAEWNATVTRAVDPLDELLPTSIVFGMADPVTLAAGLAELRDAGVKRAAIVRLFLSGRSFATQTRYLLGLSENRPDWFMIGEHVGPDTVTPIPHGLEVATHASGLMTAEQAILIMAERALARSEERSRENVLLLAHGMKSAHEDAEVVEALDVVAARIRAEGFHRVQGVTLREDWPAERAAAESVIRGHVQTATQEGFRVIVVPFRLSGFGPYAKVLHGLEYVPTAGLLPHELITDWIRNTALDTACANHWPSPLGRCR